VAVPQMRVLTDDEGDESTHEREKRMKRKNTVVINMMPSSTSEEAT
jgi:hypothetical protein